MSIAIEHVSKHFGTFQALHKVTLDIPTGELVALLGPSGSGKTTLLRMIAGLDSPDTGRILFNGENITSSHVRERQVGFVFQHYALFRHMTVFDNVAFGLKVRPRKIRPSKGEIREKVMSLLRLVQLESLAERYPAQLSGGQRQRIALARALAVEPQVLLLDEPFGALDAKVRAELRRWLRRLHDEIHVTSVFVTHDQEEALEVADRIVVMNRGVIEQQGAPDEVYSRPASPFVYSFLGTVNMFHARPQAGQSAAAKTATVGYARPHEIDVSRQDSGNGAIAVTVQRVLPLGGIVRLELTRTDNGGTMEAEIPREKHDEYWFTVGEQLFASPKNLVVFVEDYQI
mgnify:CR=1 FL=1